MAERVPLGELCFKIRDWTSWILIYGATELEGTPELDQDSVTRVDIQSRVLFVVSIDNSSNTEK